MDKTNATISISKIEEMIYTLCHMKVDLEEVENANRGELGRERIIIESMGAAQQIAKAMTNLETGKSYLEDLRNALSG